MSGWTYSREAVEEILERTVKLAKEQPGQPYTIEQMATLGSMLGHLQLDQRDQLARIEAILGQMRDRLGGVAAVVDPEAERLRREEEEAAALLESLPPGMRAALERKAAAKTGG